MTPSEVKKELIKIKNHLDKADEIFTDLPNGMKEIIYEFHHSDNSLNHCLRWGTTAVNELLESVKTITKEYNKNY